MDLKKILDELKSTDQEDLKRIGVAPTSVKVVAVSLFVILATAFGIYQFVLPMKADLESVARKESDLRRKFDSEQAKAANLEAYSEQLAQMRKTFNVMLRQLPNKTDIESLLVDLSQTSVASGLDVERFEPRNEVKKEFYAEYPIDISVTGNYHEFGSFVSGLSALPRIVTLSNIEISNGSKNKSKAAADADAELTMNLVATTYRYLDEE
ncbi:type 4a pilus biogenesis protein PilO [Granulosicoccaceae sp. 1_MG-2023]|nr:type 4a pilus biogenesis protein PilO [Granulosicoccaceae sp. 1_MG-2023]